MHEKKEQKQTEKNIDKVNDVHFTVTIHEENHRIKTNERKKVAKNKTSAIK